LGLLPPFDEKLPWKIVENHKADALCTSSIATFDERGDFFRAEGSEAWAQVAEHAAAVAGDFYP